MTGLADGTDATYFNPAGLAFQKAAMANLNLGKWFPGVPPGMCYVGAAGGAPLRSQALRGHDAYVSGSLVYMTLRSGGHSYLWRGYAAAQLAMLLTNRLGVGVGLKIAHDSYSVAWLEREFEEGTAGAVDLALLYRPLSRISVGAAVDNLGPHIVYQPSGNIAELPTLARLGACWTPINSSMVRVRVLPELTKVLVGLSADTAVGGFWQQLGAEWKSVWKALGIEATAFNLVSFRLGYFEDVAEQRGGLAYQGRGDTERYGLWDAITRTDLGRLEHVGICWGFGIGSDKLRLDVSNDAALYDRTSSNWKFSLVANDISGGIRELREGHKPWEE
jgi:hypothetical protein